MDRDDIDSEFQNLIHRKSAKDYAKSIIEYDNLLEKHNGDSLHTAQNTLLSPSNDDNFRATENIPFRTENSKTLGFRMFVLFESIKSRVNDWIERSVFINDLKTLMSTSHKCDSSPSMLKQVLQNMDDKLEYPDRFVCIERLCHDLKLYGRILHGVLFCVLFFFIFVSTHAMYRTCSLNEHSFTDWLTELAICKLSDTVIQFMKLSLLVTNIITFIIIFYDKYQACKQGYRVHESLIVFCLFAGGLPAGWFLIFALSHKTKRFNFMLNAVLATFISMFWIYLYNILNL